MVILENDLKKNIYQNRMKFEKGLEQRIKDKNFLKDEEIFFNKKLYPVNQAALTMNFFYSVFILLGALFASRIIGFYSVIFLILGFVSYYCFNYKNLYSDLKKIKDNDRSRYETYLNELFGGMVVEQQILSDFKAKHGKNALQVLLTSKENIRYKDIFRYEMYCENNENIKEISSVL